MVMTAIPLNVDLRNNCNEIFECCNEYNRLADKQELYRLIDEGLEAINKGETQPYDAFIQDLKQRIE